MANLSKRWQVFPRISAEADQALHSYPPIFRQILYNRGFSTMDTARQFLEGLPITETDPFKMMGIPEAVDRISYAIRQAKPIAIYGDYDADGVTATALLVEALQALGAQVEGYIPNRFDEGYGLNNEALANLRDKGVCLVITVDCGIRSPEEALFAQQVGLDLIITDHHQPASDLPRAVAIVNPKQPGDGYPDKDLAGVGLAYKLACALLDSFGKNGDFLPSLPSQEDYLDLVALGTVSDLAPLMGENRTLVREGLKCIRKMRRQGISSLIAVSGLRDRPINASDIGFILGPRLNAAGRLDSALAAFQLLTTHDPQQAGLWAQRLEVQNRERQEITRQIQTMAEEIALSGKPEPLLLFAAHPEFNSGVVGLAASRLTELYYRPAIVACQGETYTRGSCRSIPEFHITDALDQCADLLEHHGGHAAAAGFTVRNEKLPELLERMQQIASKQLSSKDLRPTLAADAEVGLSDLHPDLLDYLDWLQPTGYGNPQAAFISRNLKVTNARPVGKDGAHLKLSVTDGWLTFDAIAFRQGQWLSQLPPRVDLLYTFERNDYNGRTTLQLNVRDIKPSGKE